MNRNAFLKSACITGSCLCGFGLASLPANSSSTGEETVFFRSWISMLLSNANDDKNSESLKKALKNASFAHYDQLNMKEVLNPFVGKLEHFIDFLKSNWGWKVEYNLENNVVIADENKNHCVCPLVQHPQTQNLSLLCYCSEGFAEKMFSFVVGHPVSARVTSSILRGDESCRYEIDLN